MSWSELKRNPLEVALCAVLVALVVPSINWNIRSRRRARRSEPRDGQDLDRLEDRWWARGH